MCFWGFYIDFIPINKESREKLRFIDLIAIILNRRFWLEKNRRSDFIAIHNTNFCEKLQYKID